MPNEIKTPKVLKETIKQVYELMKAESLLLEFDRRTVLRLIIEALTPEEINTLITAGRSGDKKVFKKIMKQYHPDLVKNKGGSEEEQQKAQDTYQQASKFDTYFNDPDNKKNFNNPGLWPKDIQDIMKNAGVTGKPTGDQQAQGTQQAQGGEQEASPEVKQTIAQLALKYHVKYNPLFKKLIMTLNIYKKQPEKFFQDQKFIDELVQIASSLKEAVDSEIEKELGLQPGKTKENLEKIVAGLEKIRNALIQALSKKGELTKQRPQGESGQEAQPELNEQMVDPDDDNNVSTLFDWYAENEDFDKKARAFIGGQSDDNLEAGFYQLDKPTKVLMKEGDRKEWFRGKKAGVEKELQAGNLNRAAYLLQGEINKWEGEIDKVGAELRKTKFKDKEIVKLFKHQLQVWIDLYKIAGTITDSVEGNKQAGKPKEVPFDPAGIEKIGGNELTIQGDDGNSVTVTKEEAKITYDIIDAADKFRRIYAILMKYLFSKAPDEVQKILPEKEVLQIDYQPIVKPGEATLTTTPEKQPVAIDSGDPTDIPDDEGPKEKSTGFNISTSDFKNWYYKDSTTLKENKDESTIDKPRSMYKAFLEFKTDFVTVPMLRIQTAIFTQIYEKVKWLSDVDNLKTFGMGSTTAGRTKTPTQTEPEKKQPEKIVTEAEGDANQVEFDENDIQVFKDEYERLLKLARIINKLVGKLDGAKDLDTVGGGEIVKQSRQVADILQDSLSRLHDTMSQELSDFVGKGGRLNEQEPDSDTNLEREQDFEAEMQSAADEIFGVHDAVVGYLTTIDKAVRETKTETLDSSKILPRAEKVLQELNSIKKHFPSISPFGKETDDPQGMIDDMKIFLEGIVTDVEDLMQQLKGITTAEKKALKEATEKRYTDKQTVEVFLNKIVEVAQQVQDYFDAPSRIGKVAALRSKKVTNMDDAAALNKSGIKAVKQGKAEAPQVEEKEEKGKPINSHSQAITALNTYKDKIAKIQDELSDSKSAIRDVAAIDSNAFLGSLVVLLNKFPTVKEEVGPTVTGNIETPSFKMFNIDEEKLAKINELIKLDKTGSLSIMFSALKKDNLGAKKLKALVTKYLPKNISFGLDTTEAKKFFTSGEQKEVKQEQLEKKLEKLIEHYINSRN